MDAVKVSATTAKKRRREASGRLARRVDPAVIYRITKQDTEPTARQLEVLTWVKAFWVQYGCSPSLREIAAGLGIKSLNAVVGHLHSLTAKRLIFVMEGRKRGVRPIVPEGCCAACGQRLEVGRG